MSELRRKQQNFTVIPRIAIKGKKRKERDREREARERERKL